MEITLSLPGPSDMVRIGLSASKGRSREAFEPLVMTLRYWTSINVWILRYMKLPSIYSGGVRYVAEPEGEERWFTVDKIIAMGQGDCEDLACARTAELIVAGIKARPVLKWKWIGGLMLIHILVALPDGTIEDPSKRLGMKGSY